MSKKGYLIGAIILVVVVVFILAGAGKKSINSNNSSNYQPIKVSLVSQSNSGISGTATISDESGKTKVILNLTGTPANSEEPAHIHLGTCVSLGEPKYPLTSVKNGSSETILEVPISKIISSTSLAINIHKSEAEMSASVACGEIQSSAKSN